MKSFVVLVPGLFDQSYEVLDQQTPLACAQTPALDRLATKGEWLKVPCPEGGAKQVWAELLGLSGQRVNLSVSALEIYAHQIDFKPGQCSFLFQFRTRSYDKLEEYDPNLLKPNELAYLCEELNIRFGQWAQWIPTKNSQGVCLFYEMDRLPSQEKKAKESATSFFSHPTWIQRLQELEAFLESHSFNELRRDFEEPLCTALYFYAPGSPLHAIASSAFYNRFSLFSSSLIPKGLAYLLKIQHKEISKEEDLSHLSELIQQVEQQLDGKQHFILEVDDLMDRRWNNGVLEKIKRLEYLDRHFFSKLSDLAFKRDCQLFITPMLYSKGKNSYEVPWLRVHPQRKPLLSSVFSFNEEVVSKIMGTHTIHYLASQLLQ